MLRVDVDTQGMLVVLVGYTMQLHGLYVVSMSNQGIRVNYL
jgi:hypothetical protein